ncbi:hypothetical protein AArcMg_1492 [Natrarchaeobaculum sulfurireducens]|uniref:Phage head morphogenesis domain-containing protein n=1 Tax=Natrarchaeobaculum sulfurireducens TaxID=2044521 RepID=A0A346PPR0_9EURY|nr:hypothetical protein AArcMg_1492 [Natrarchaeobaculum sulfurireducens]
MANGAASQPSGQRTRHFYETQGHGIPRMDDLLAIRQMERRHTVQIPMETVLKQVTTMEWNIVPTVDEPDEVHWEAVEVVEEFLDGGFNSNDETFDQFLKKWVRDIVSINSGIVELVPTEPDNNGNQWLGEMYVRDGATFTKQVDIHDRYPEPPEAAFYQFGRNRVGGVGVGRSRDQTIQELIEESDWAQRVIRHNEPIAFTRDQIVWAAENPVSYDPYGFGRVQSIKNLVEILINQDLSNKKYFTANEVPEGMLSLVEANQDQVKRFREDWKDNIQGEQHKMAIVGGQVDWTPFRANPEELQFLESQEWYNKLVWMAFGLGPNEVGHLDDVNRATAKEQSATIFRKTTKPLLKLIEHEINDEILSKHRAVNIVEGEIAFEWEMHNHDVEAIEREKQHEDLQHNLTTINAVRAERGDEEVWWGDMPAEAVQALARKHPEWFAEQAGIEDPPEDVPSLLSADGPVGTSRSDDDIVGGQGDFSDRGLSHNEALHPERTETLTDGFGLVLDRMADDLEPIIEDVYPEENDGDSQVNVDAVTSAIDIAGELESHALDAEVAVLQEAAEAEAEELAGLIEEEIDAAPADIRDIEIDFDVENTFAYEQLVRRTRQQMMDAETTMSRIVRNSLLDADSIDEAKDSLQSSVEDMTEGHAETIARTQLNSADRHGSQALAESTDVIGGKQWHATEDGRERSWHGAMDGEVVEKDQEFVVPDTGDSKQPDDYPRRTHVVGEDHPYNCRCRQSSVLSDDMETDAFELDAISDAVSVDLGITQRQYEVWCDHHEAGESFADTWCRLRDDLSVSEIGDKIVSTATVYKWDDEVGYDR